MTAATDPAPISRSLPTVDRIREALRRNAVDYWTRERDDKPNLSRMVFEAVLAVMPSNVTFKRPRRESNQGPHGHDGDDFVFMTEFEAVFMGVKRRFFIKGYFYPKGNTQGVTIQSFRYA